MIGEEVEEGDQYWGNFFFQFLIYAWHQSSPKIGPPKLRRVISTGVTSYFFQFLTYAWDQSSPKIVPPI